MGTFNKGLEIQRGGEEVILHASNSEFFEIYPLVYIAFNTSFSMPTSLRPNDDLFKLSCIPSTRILRSR